MLNSYIISEGGSVGPKVIINNSTFVMSSLGTGMLFDIFVNDLEDFSRTIYPTKVCLVR